MSKKIKLWSDPYDTGHDLYKKKSVTINPGVTVLVGCNGIGKSTLLSNIRYVLGKEEIPYISFDNLIQGGANSRSEFAFRGNFDFVATSMCSSEGENIMMNASVTANKIGKFLRKNPDAKELWILLDAVDSGLSVDNIVEVKEFFNLVLGDHKNKDIYILVSANEYEMANGEQCMDVHHMKYIQFADYKDYRQFILNSRSWKDNREK